MKETASVPLPHVTRSASAVPDLHGGTLLLGLSPSPEPASVLGSVTLTADSTIPGNPQNLESWARKENRFGPAIIAPRLRISGMPADQAALSGAYARSAFSVPNR